MCVLDTHVILELRRGKPHQSLEVRAWADGQPSSKLFLSAITVLELEMGILALDRRTHTQGNALRTWLTGVRKAFAGRSLAFTDIAATICAALYVPNHRSERGAIVAATAFEHGFTVVTRNETDFASTGVELVNPWTL